MPLLDVDQLRVGYGLADVLHGVSISVEQGQLAAVIGANGAGKSTLLRAISGLVPSQSGSIQFAGETISRYRPHEIVRRGLSHVPEGRGVLADLSVRDNLRLGAYVYGSPKSDALDQIFTWFPVLSERLDQAAGTLSGGEQQMLAISRSILSRPRLLIIDELSLGLAPKIASELLDRLIEIRTQGTSLLIVDQNIHKMLDVADQIYVLAHGRIVFSGQPMALRGDSALMATYLGLD